MDMDNDEAATGSRCDSDFRPQRAEAPGVYGLDPSIRACESEPSPLRRNVMDSPGARSEGAIGGSQPVKSRNFGSLADDVSRSIIQYGLHEAAYMSVYSEDRARLCSPMLSSAGTWASASEDSMAPPRIPPGCQLESLETTPLGSAGKDESSTSSLKPMNQNTPVLLPFETWCERVLRQLFEEAHSSSTAIRRDLVPLTPTEIAHIFGVKNWSNWSPETVETAETAESVAAAESEAKVEEAGPVEVSPSQNEGYVAPLVPRLNLENIKREIEDEYDDEYDEEDFVNKVGSEAVGVASSIAKTEVKAKIPPLALASVGGPGPGEHINDTQNIPLEPPEQRSDPGGISLSKAGSRKRGLLPLAEVFKRKSRRDLSMYCDDLTLMLLKHRPKAKQGLAKSKSAVQLPPLELKPAPRQASPVLQGWQHPAVVHDHFHYHFHVPSGQLR